MSAAETTLALLLESHGVTGWEREVQFDRRETGCECQQYRYIDHPTEVPGIIRCEVTDAPLGHVPGTRKPWVKCKACNGRGFVTVGRKWALDFAFVAEKVGVEVNGGGWTRGRHHRPQGHRNDCEKWTAAALQGWTLVLCTPEQVRSGEAVEWIKDALRKRREE